MSRGDNSKLALCNFETTKNMKVSVVRDDICIETYKINQSQQAKQGKIPFHRGTPSELSNHVILGIKCECPSWKAGHAQEALLSGSFI